MPLNSKFLRECELKGGWVGSPLAGDFARKRASYFQSDGVTRLKTNLEEMFFSSQPR
jgi:hypothetical protein